MKIPALFTLASILIVWVAIAWRMNTSEAKPAKLTVAVSEATKVENFDAENFFTSEFERNISKEVPGVVESGEVYSSTFVPDDEEMVLIGRLVKGIIRWKKKNGWWECGVKYGSLEVIQDLALTYAYEIVRAAHEVGGQNGEVENWKLNIWGFAGMIVNESKMDRCAFGLHPRKKAYAMGLIKRSRLTISHKEAEVLKAVNDSGMQEYFKKSGFDLGTGQLLSRFYPDPTDYAYMISLRGSTERAAWSMRKRARMYKTSRPWRYWRGYNCLWYDGKVVRWARMLGAKIADLTSCSGDCKMPPKVTVPK